MRRIAALVLFTIAVAACGGGSGDDDAVIEPPSSIVNDALDENGQPAAPNAGGGATGDETPDDLPAETPVDPLGSMVLNGLGIDTGSRVLAFGTPADEVVGEVTTLLGPPTNDTGSLATIENGCPTNSDTFRTVNWGGLELVFMSQSGFTEVTGEHLVFWFNPGSEVDAQAFVGDGTVVPIVNDVTTVDDLTFQLGDAVDVFDDVFGPVFVASDNFGEVRGEVSGVADDDVVLSSNAGIGCGE